MDPEKLIIEAGAELSNFLARPNAYRAFLVLIVSIAFAYWLSRLLAKAIIFLAQKISVRTDVETREEKVILLRQVETYLSVTLALGRAVIVAVVAYVTWRILSPESSIGGSTAAAIGAGTFFVVFAGQTLGILLRDITAGAIMIIEKWFRIGDFIKIEPFSNVQGVVEQMSLRSTKLRSLSGEIIWIHNQQIQGVHVTPRALRVIAVDVFVKEPKVAKKEIEKVISAVPTGPTLLARPLRLKKEERWGEGLWRLTVVGETAPGREWLVEQFFVNALKALDEDKPKEDKLFVYEPLARFTDPIADKRFKRAVKIQRER